MIVFQVMTASGATVASTSSSRTYTGFYSNTFTAASMSATVSSSTSNGSVSHFKYSTHSSSSSGSATGDGGYREQHGETVTALYSYTRNVSAATEFYDGVLSRSGSWSANLYDEEDPPNITSSTSESTSTTDAYLTWFGYGNVSPFSYTYTYPSTSATAAPATGTRSTSEGTSTAVSASATYQTARTSISSSWRYTSSTVSTTTATTNTSASTSGTASTTRGTTATTSQAVTTVVNFSTSLGTWGYEEGSGTYVENVALTASTTLSVLSSTFSTVAIPSSGVAQYVTVLQCRDGETGYLFSATGFGRIGDVAASFTRTTLPATTYLSTAVIVVSAVDSSARVTITVPASFGISQSSSVSTAAPITFVGTDYAAGNSFPEPTRVHSVYPPSTTLRTYSSSSNSLASYTQTGRSTQSTTQYSISLAAGRGSIVAAATGLSVASTTSFRQTETNITTVFNPPTSVSATGTFAGGGSTSVSSEGYTSQQAREQRTGAIEIFPGYAQGPGWQVVSAAEWGGRHLPLDLTASGGPTATAGAISASPSASWIPRMSGAWRAGNSSPVSYPGRTTTVFYTGSSTVSVTASFAGNQVLGTTATVPSGTGDTLASGTVSASLTPVGTIPAITKCTTPGAYQSIVPPQAASYALAAGVYRVCSGGSFAPPVTHDSAVIIAAAAGVYIEPVSAFDIQPAGWIGSPRYSAISASVVTPSFIS